MISKKKIIITYKFANPSVSTAIPPTHQSEKACKAIANIKEAATNSPRFSKVLIIDSLVGIWDIS